MSMTQYKAVNAFIFAGSFSIGVMNAGFDLKKVLEISDSILEQNAFYFRKNYPSIPVILPKEWENEEYLDRLKGEDIDLMCCNCPCSSLSTINRHASVDGKNNIHFYRLFNIFEHVQPKVFVIENAPTLIKLGFPILKDLASRLNDRYFITVIHDMAGNHNVPMQRMRTMIVGWRKDYFKKHPIVKPDPQPRLNAYDAIKDIITNEDDHKSKEYDDIRDLYKFAINGIPIMTSLALRYAGKYETTDEEKTLIKDVINKSSHKKEFCQLLFKIEHEERIWDKSPFRAKAAGYFPSISSVQEYLHPVQNRTLNVRELKRLMGYPDEFDFSDLNHECKIPLTQAIAQGVPVNFGKWIAEQAKAGLDGELDEVDADIIYQNHIKREASPFTVDEFMSLDCLELKKEDRFKL